MRTTTLTIFGFLAINLTIGGRAFGTPVTITGGAVAPSPDVPGMGLCMASAVSIQPAQDFSQSQASFNTSLNDFMEVHKADRVESVLVVTRAPQLGFPTWRTRRPGPAATEARTAAYPEAAPVERAAAREAAASRPSSPARSSLCCGGSARGDRKSKWLPAVKG
jgi:hypothetical protein